MLRVFSSGRWLGYVLAVDSLLQHSSFMRRLYLRLSDEPTWRCLKNHSIGALINMSDIKTQPQFNHYFLTQTLGLLKVAQEEERLRLDLTVVGIACLFTYER